MLPMRFELIISSLQDWCLTTMALEAYFILYLFLIKHIIKNTVTGNRTLVSFLKESVLPLNHICLGVEMRALQFHNVILIPL